MRAQRRGSSLVVRAGLTEVGKYLSEAAAAIFKPQKSDVNWEGTSTGFSGAISHHEDLPRLRAVYESVRRTREQVAGCMDPNASNYSASATSDDGSCTYVFNEKGGRADGPDNLHDYLTDTVERVFNNNFSGDKTEPSWEGTTYNYTGDIVPQRDIQRLLSYEKAVKSVLDKAEAAAKKN